MNWLSFGDIGTRIDNISAFQPRSDFEKKIINFIADWQSNVTSYSFHTSGSTGTPKTIRLSKQQMTASAEATVSVLGLVPGQTSLLCINPDFIGGKMMIVRALLNRMNLIAVPPSSNPLLSIDAPVHFTAMVPLQVKTVLKYAATGKKLNRIGKLLIGGAPADGALRRQLKTLDTEVYSTYGMTETASHVALENLSRHGEEGCFTALPNVHLSVDARNCLVINAPMTGDVDVVTNDVVTLVNPQQFGWLGRYDNVINSGGIKIHPEQLEKRIMQVLRSHHFDNRLFVTAKKDERLGQKVVLVMEGNALPTDRIRAILKASLDNYTTPREIVVVEKFQETATGKIIRKPT